VSYLPRTGFRLLFWLASVLVDGSLTDEQRKQLHAICISFSNDSQPPPERQA